MYYAEMKKTSGEGVWQRGGYGNSRAGEKGGSGKGGGGKGAGRS